MTKKLLAILMALALVLSFAACGSKKDDAETSETTTNEFDAFGEDEETSAADETAEEATDETAEEASDEETTAEEASDEETTAAADEETTAADGETTKAADAKATKAADTKTTAAKTTKAAAKAPSTKAEIIEYYNTAINKVKPSAKSIKVESIENKPAGSVSGLPSALSSIADSVIASNTGVDEDASGKTYTSAADKKANFPVENETWSSKLTEADVQSATIQESGSQYMITIVTKADAKSSNVAHGSGHAPKAFSVTMPAVINDNVPSAVSKMFSVGTASLGYPASTIKVIVDKDTGNVKTAQFDLLWTMYIPVGSSTVVIPFETISKYTIAW